MSILKEKGIDPIIRDYIKDPLSVQELRGLCERLNLRPKDFIRKKESAFKELNLEKLLNSDDKLISEMSKHPKLIERPIVEKNNKAILCRPPERVLELL